MVNIAALEFVNFNPVVKEKQKDKYISLESDYGLVRPGMLYLWNSIEKKTPIAFRWMEGISSSK